MALEKRIEFVCLTAASGDLDNLDLAIRNTGCVPSVAVLEAAARAGHLHVCQWLKQQGFFFWNREAITAGLYAALRGGHVGLMDWFLQQLPDRGDVDVGELLVAAAEGCDLAKLQRLHKEWNIRKVPLDAGDVSKILDAAAASPTPDWQSKFEWLQPVVATGARNVAVRIRTAVRPDAVDRLRWLKQKGYPLGAWAVCTAAASGNMPALQYLLEDAGLQGVDLPLSLCNAAGGGHLAALQALHARGYPPDMDDLRAAAEGGHLAVVAWVLEQMGPDVADDAPDLLSFAARSGSVELMAWLHERGWPWDEEVFCSAAEGGCEAALTWLVEQGCPMPDAYCQAASNGDLATLRCLRRLGCPWDSEETFTRAVREGAPLAALRWLVEEGCPVDWDQAMGEARAADRNGTLRAALKTLRREQRLLRQGAAV